MQESMQRSVWGWRRLPAWRQWNHWFPPSLPAHNACLFPHRDFRIILPLGGKTRGWEKSSNALVEKAYGSLPALTGNEQATLSISPFESRMPVMGALLLFLFYLLNPLLFPLCQRMLPMKRVVQVFQPALQISALRPLLGGTVLSSFETEVLFKDTIL